MEEFWRRGQQQQKNKGWQQLHHRLMANHFFEGPMGDGLEQPATNHKETRQSEEVKHTIESHQRTIHTEITDMSIEYENHCKSSHRIDVFYPLFRHFMGKGTEKSRKSWQFGYKILFLHHERKD